MPNIVKELSLNKHPKDCKDLSLINARNIMVSNDFSCLQNELNITEHPTLQDYLENRILVGYIPCNTEVVLFTVSDDDYDSLKENQVVIDCTISRYNEENNSIIDCLSNFKYHGGKIVGTFTYNVYNNLIIAVGEHDAIIDKDIPLRTINLDTDIVPGGNIDAGLHPISPEVILPKISDFSYVPGTTYKGWYYFFIRYKINNVDYTHWFPIGYPIFICDIEKQSIFKYGFKDGKYPNANYYSLTGIIDYFSSKSNIANETVELYFNNFDNRYNYYQVGFICVAKDSSKAFRSNDINIGKNTFNLSIADSNNYSVNDLILDNYNYYNVKNIINYQNRLYISNFKQSSNPIISDAELNKIKITYEKELNTLSDYSYQNIYIDDEEYEENTVANVISSEENNTSLSPTYEYIPANPTYTGTIIPSLVIGNTILITDIEIGTYNERGYITTNKGTQVNADLELIVARSARSRIVRFTITCEISNRTYKTIYQSAYGTSMCNDLYNDFTDNIIISGNPDVLQNNALFINTNNSFKVRKKQSTLLPGEIYSFYIHFVNKYGESTDGYRIPNIYGLNNPNTDGYFESFINNNGDILYKVPYSDFEFSGSDAQYYIYKFKFDLQDFNLPDEYIGYYFSYEKFESTIKFKGILTKKDISSQSELESTDDNIIPYNNYNETNIDKLDVVHFYSSNLDINDALELDVNTLHIIKSATLYNGLINYPSETAVEFANGRYPANLNKPEYQGTIINETYPLDKYSLSIAGDVLKDKKNLGTSLEIKVTDDIKSLFANEEIYKAELIKVNNNIYTNENKILIKFTDIYYIERTGIVDKGLNGHITYNNFLVYDFNKFIFNSQNNTILSEKYGLYYFTDVLNIDGNNDSDYEDNEDYVVKHMSSHRAPIYYAQLFTYDTIFNESKSFKNEPQIYYLQLEKTNPEVSSQIKQFAQNIIVLPENTVDLFENKYSTQDALNPKTFVNHDVNKEYIDTYNKRVRRSNVIADESNENSWRVFPLEGYKDITENKGIITNIVGVGTTFLVHTEHSLFMFDRNNTLQTADKEVQLAMPDIFDVDYKEVFTSDLGICGLQDRDAHIVDQFGYIFYDNDAHRIYKFGQGKIENIDLDIIQFLNKYKPYRIRFANDKEASRLLVNMYFHSAIEAIPQEETLSFNYVINKWISFHDYVFDVAFNTKQMLYYLINRKDDNLNVYTNIYTINDLFNYKDHSNSVQNIYYNKFENIRENREVNVSTNSIIDIICNPSYEHIKYLEYIAYKLYKINIDSDIYSPTPVEKLKQPYSGDTLRVFNTEVDTGLLNILVNDESPNTGKNRAIMNYKKPWWELGNWNFNYLRDSKQGNVKFPTRLYGNYFVIRFILKDDYRRIEFESLEYQITKDKP